MDQPAPASSGLRLRCAACQLSYVVPNPVPGREYRCQTCGGPLAAAQPAPAASEDSLALRLPEDSLTLQPILPGRAAQEARALPPAEPAVRRADREAVRGTEEPRGAAPRFLARKSVAGGLFVLAVAAALLMVALAAGWLRPSPNRLEELRVVLRQGTPAAREAHARALAADLREGRIARDGRERRQAVEALRLAAGDDDPEGRAAAAALEALGEFGGEEDRALLLDCLSAKRPILVRSAALGALKKLRPPGIGNALMELARRDADLGVRLAAIDTLGDCVEPALLVAIAELAARGEPRALALAARAKLARLRPAQSLPALYAGGRAGIAGPAVANLLKATGDYEKRLEEAEKTLNPPGNTKTRQPEAYEVAAEKLRDSNRDERLLAAWDLGELAEPRAEEALLGALRDPDETVGLTAAEALGRLPAAKRSEHLAELLEDGEPRTRQAAARAYGLVRPAPPAAPLLTALAKEKSSGAAAEMAQAVGKLRPSGAVSVLVAVLSDGPPPARRRAARALGQLGDASACAALVEALGRAGGDEELKTEAAGALSALTGKNLGPDAEQWRAAGVGK